MILSAAFERRCHREVMRLAAETVETLMKLFAEEVERQRNEEQPLNLTTSKGANSSQISEPAVVSETPSNEGENLNADENHAIDLSLSVDQLINSNNDRSNAVAQSEIFTLSTENSNATVSPPNAESAVLSTKENLLENVCGFDDISNDSLPSNFPVCTSLNNNNNSNIEPPAPENVPSTSISKSTPLPVELGSQSVVTMVERTTETSVNAENCESASTVPNQVNRECSTTVKVKAEINEASIEVPLTDTAFLEPHTELASSETVTSTFYKWELDDYYEESGLLYDVFDEGHTENANANNDNLQTLDIEISTESGNEPINNTDLQTIPTTIASAFAEQLLSNIDFSSEANSDVVNNNSNNEVQNTTNLPAIANAIHSVTPNTAPTTDQTSNVPSEQTPVKHPSLKRKHSVEKDSTSASNGCERGAKRKILTPSFAQNCESPNNVINEQLLNLSNTNSNSKSVETVKKTAFSKPSSNKTPSQKHHYSEKQSTTHQNTAELSNSSKQSSASKSSASTLNTTPSTEHREKTKKSSKLPNNSKVTGAKEKSTFASMKTTPLIKISTEIGTASDNNKISILARIEMVKVIGFKCKSSLCNAIFKNKNELANHMLAIHKQPPFDCLIADCPTILNNENEWINHTKDVHKHDLNSKQLNCHCCSDVFANELDLLDHYVFQHEQGKFQCSRCHRYEDKKRISVYRHMIERKCDKHLDSQASASVLSSSTSAIADFPKKKFQKSRSFSASTDWRAGGGGSSSTNSNGIGDYSVRNMKLQALSCMRCTAEFPDELKLISHMAKEHRAAAFACPIDKCTQSFTTRDYLLKHMLDLTVHSRPFHCLYCLKNFSEPEILLNHVKVYHQMGKFACLHNWCTNLKAFSTIAEMQQHNIKTHTNKYFVEKLDCTVKNCPFACHNEGKLISHLCKEHAIEEFTCLLCPKSFKYDYQLNDHVAETHPNPKWLCAFCPDKKLKPNTQEKLRRHIEGRHHTGVFWCSYTGCQFKASCREVVLSHFYGEHFYEKVSSSPLAHAQSPAKRPLTDYH